MTARVTLKMLLVAVSLGLLLAGAPALADKITITQNAAHDNNCGATLGQSFTPSVHDAGYSGAPTTQRFRN